jgi:hypothetical protein
MTKRFIKLLSLLTIFSCCNSITKTNQLQKVNDSLNILINDTSAYFNRISKVRYVDTINYTALNTTYKKWDDTMEIDSRPLYYLDTFTESGNKFRLVHIKEDYDNVATLEKFINGHWIRRIEFERFNGSGDVTHSMDVNNDGYNDITEEHKFSNSAYFFDIAKNDFIHTSGAYINDFFLLDTTKNLFCDFEEYRQMCGQIHSRLYTFRNFKRIDLFDLELYNCTETNNDVSLVTKLILSKYYERKTYKPNWGTDSLVALKTIKLSKPINLDKDYDPNIGYFDYVNFWRKNYKRLMGYSQH